MKIFEDLIKEVHKAGICQQCGGCVSFCNSIENDVIGFKKLNLPPVYLNRDKCYECGLCYLICPQTHVLEEEINKSFNFTNFNAVPLGFFYNIYSCQSSDQQFLKLGTDGGVLNALINFLLEKEIIDGAIVAKTIAPFCRESFIAKSKKDLIEASGIKLDIAPQLKEMQKFHTYAQSLPKLKQHRFKRLAVVGTPCQIYTIRSMQNLGIVPSETIELCLGLFCYENFFFDQEKVSEFETEFNIKFKDIEKINIKEDLIVSLKEDNLEKKTIHISFDKLNNYMRSACKACKDFTNIYADISFGGLGSPEKFTTVITRTEKGKNIVLKAIKSEVIKCKQLKLEEKDCIKEHISNFSILKMKRYKEFLKKNKK